MQETQGDRIIDYFYDSNGQAIALKYRANAAATGVYYYYAYNSRGDIIGLYDANGTKYCTYSYDPWGNILSVKNANGGNISSDTIAYYQSLRYRGYVYDNETGLYYLQSRYYDPVTHRFINEDSITDSGSKVLGYNLFVYCANNPVNAADHNGAWFEWVSGVLNIVGGALEAVAGAALGATLGWTGFGAVVAGFLIADGIATTAQGIGQTVNNIAGSQILPEENLLRSGFQSLGRAVGGDTGAEVAGAVYDVAAIGAGIYAGSKFSQPSCCFVAGTAVLTKFGNKSIEEIRVGDYVWSQNTGTGDKELKRVLHTFERESDELVYLQISGETIITTPEHPFYVPTKGWSKAISLRAGDILITVNGQIAIVESVQHEILENPVKVYNFEVEDFHTYYISSLSVLVHNVCNGSTGSYEINFESGKNYVGKGSQARMRASARYRGMVNADRVVSMKWTPAASRDHAFVDEYFKMLSRGVNNPNTYNKIWSPGRNIYRKSLLR